MPAERMDRRPLERGDDVAHEQHNGEHTEEWPATGRPVSGDDSDAAVRVDETQPEATESPWQADETSTQAEQPARDTTVGGPDHMDTSDDDGNTVDIHNAGARDIDATTVSITQGGARDIDATNVTINQGGAARIRADELNISQGGVALARAEHLTLQEGGSAFAVIADNATLDPETSVFLLIAGSTKGDVRPVMDWRAAAAFGAGFAFVLGLLRRVRR